MGPGRRRLSRRAKIWAVLGPILLAVGIVLVLPPLFLISGMAVTAILGWVAVEHAEETHEGSELIDLNV